jgi:hypothetical protein
MSNRNNEPRNNTNCRSSRVERAATRQQTELGAQSGTVGSDHLSRADVSSFGCDCSPLCSPSAPFQPRPTKPSLDAPP